MIKDILKKYMVILILKLLHVIDVIQNGIVYGLQIQQRTKTEKLRNKGEFIPINAVEDPDI